MSNKQDNAMLVSNWNHKFKIAMVHKAEYTKKWNNYYDAYNGDYFKNTKLPDYRSDMVSNYIFAIVETVRPIMLDNDPKFQAMPRQQEGMKLANDLQEALTYEWDREKVNKKLYRELINTLVIGNSIFFVPWDEEKKNVRAIPVNPFNIFPDPLATSIDDSEYIIYASYYNVDVLKRLYPSKKDKLSGSSINYTELVYENDVNSNIDNQVLVLEVYTRDYESLDSKNKLKYPNGRILTMCPELGILLDDKPNPYKDGKFPFVVIKDYDIPGKFWGEGEVAQLLSPQKSINDLNNSIIDNAKSTANMPWIVDNNAGIAKGSITARPGLIIRKNPGSEIKREQPPTMPSYVANAVETFKSDIEMISGIHNTLRGENTSGVYTAQGILALQEAGQVRIRLKVKLLEESLAEIAELWVSRMKQYWKDDKWINITKSDGSYDLKKFRKETLKYDYDVKITAGSTMPVNRGAMLDLMIRLSQTMMPDGMPLVDREAVVQYLPEEIKSALMERMNEHQSSLQEVEAGLEEIGQALEQVTNELSQAIQQVSAESQQADEETFEVIEEIMGAIEGINDQILQLSGEYDKMVAEEEEQKKIKQIQDEFYDKGYIDAEKLYNQEDTIPEGTTNDGGVPDELISGMEAMSDDELDKLFQDNPELFDIL